MYAIHRILVAVKDPQARTHPAIAKAGQLARALDAEVCLFHAIPEPVYLDVAMASARSLLELEKDATTAHQQRLERLAKPLRQRGVKVTTAVEWDHPSHEAVIRAATHFEADLIVAECRRTSHVAPWLLHFTDWELLRNSALPVLLVKNRRPYRRSRVLAAVDPTHAYAKPANLDDEILRFSDTVATALHGSLHVVHAYNPLVLDLSRGTLASPQGIATAQAEAAARAHAELDPKLDTFGIAIARRHVIGGFAIDVIQNVAHEVKAELVVMGAVSRSGLKRLLIGNTAERLLDRLGSDLLIIKPRQFTAAVARGSRGPRVIAAPLPPGGMVAAG